MKWDLVSSPEKRNRKVRFKQYPWLACTYNFFMHVWTKSSYGIVRKVSWTVTIQARRKHSRLVGQTLSGGHQTCSLVRASDRHSEDPGSILAGSQCFYYHQMTFHISSLHLPTCITRMDPQRGSSPEDVRYCWKLALELLHLVMIDDVL